MLGAASRTRSQAASIVARPSQTNPIAPFRRLRQPSRSEILTSSTTLQQTGRQEMPAFFVGGMPESQTGDPTTAGSWVGCWNCIDQAPEKSDIAEIVRPAPITSKGVLKS